MVNTRVKDPLRRTVNRKIDRQKRARTRQNRRVLLNPLDDEAGFRIQVHNLKLSELKKERHKLAERKERTPTDLAMQHDQ